MTGFDTIINRKGSQCYKWDYLDQFFGDDGILPLTVADMDFATPVPIIAALQERLNHPIFGYTGPGPGYLPAIAKWMHQRHGWEVSSEWLVDVPGVIPAMHFCIQSFTAPGDQIVVQPPVYDPFFQAVKCNNRSLVMNPLLLEEGQYKIDFEHLEDCFKQGAKMLLFCSPHNPVGRVWTTDELRQLLALCARYKVWLISDEIHHDIIYSGAKHVMVGALAEDFDRVITLTSPGKTFNIQGLQCAAVILPDGAHKKLFLEAKHRNGLYLSHTLSMIAYEAAYTSGAPWLEKLLAYLEENLQLLKSAFATSNTIDLIVPEGTYVAWLDMRELHMDSLALKDFFVEKAKVGLQKGVVYGDQGDGFMRINFALPKHQLEQALDRIITAAR